MEKDWFGGVMKVVRLLEDGEGAKKNQEDIKMRDITFINDSL